MITTLIIILNLILLEIVLSIDNAAVLSTMVNDLPKEDQKKALTYGILGAYLFRGLALLFASFLINLGWLKLVGGLYLIYLAINSFRKSEDVKLRRYRVKLQNGTTDTLYSIDFQ